jgi:hypothetical protein
MGHYKHLRNYWTLRFLYGRKAEIILGKLLKNRYEFYEKKSVSEKVQLKN